MPNFFSYGKTDPMAEGKKSFLLYCDIKHTVEHLTDDQAGKLFKHIIAYVNDQDPETEDIVIRLAFEPIKQQLKRDLQKWEGERHGRAVSGKIGGLKSGESRRSKQTKQVLQNRSNGKQNEANEAVNVNVTVNDTVNENATSTAVPELGIELVSKVSNEAWNDQKWKETLCMGLGITIAELKKWMALFNSSISNTRLDGDFDKQRYSKMCQGWILYQQSKGTKVETGLQKTSNAPPLR